ncbi:uncharacterized protein LOC119685269 [Teleopsis dalmanni]|uniref:uncharacterized protein LOC119682185 n=1 Tax=Teleopsis dalmanni TaxID=139649 RepID=UPI0018CD0CCF|nr:uncharacterized protein LOC119682185 [Teleopsis dalmanni]XP_037955437.1 uncharacterized protein LOC119685269 [Teleopsis dalmanni]
MEQTVETTSNVIAKPKKRTDPKRKALTKRLGSSISVEKPMVDLALRSMTESGRKISLTSIQKFVEEHFNTKLNFRDKRMIKWYIDGLRHNGEVVSTSKYFLKLA